MADAIGRHPHRMDEDFVQINVGVLLLAIVSVAWWWGASNYNYDNSNSSAPRIRGRIMDKLKREINENVQKLHGEMGFAEWIVYFIYGAFVAIVLAVVLLLMLIKYNRSKRMSRSFAHASTQTKSITSVFYDMMYPVEGESAVSTQIPYGNTAMIGNICTEDSGVNFVRDFEDTDSKQQRPNGYSGARDEYLNHSCEEYSDPDETVRLPCTRTRLDISFLKAKNRHYPGDAVRQSAFALAIPQTDNKVAILEYYSTHYFMPCCLSVGRQESPGLTDIPKIEITVDGDSGSVNGGDQYFN